MFKEGYSDMILNVKDLSKSFGGLKALDAINLSVKEGGFSVL